MKQLREIEHMKIYKERLLFPYDKKQVMKNNLVLMNAPTVDSGLKIFNDKSHSCYHNNKYTKFYMDAFYNFRVINRVVRLKFRQDRAVIYKQLDIDKSVLKGVINIEANQNKNLYYDISKNHELFLNAASQLQALKLLEQYQSFLSNILKNEVCSSYDSKVMIIDIDGWFDTKTKINKKFLDEPITILYLMMLKRYNLFKSLGDIDMIFVSGTTGKKFRMNPSECNSKSYQLFKYNINKLAKNNQGIIDIPEEGDVNKTVDKTIAKEDIKKQFMASFALTGDEDVVEKIVNSKIDDYVDNAMDKLDSDEEKEDDEDGLDSGDMQAIKDEVHANLNKDKDILKEIYQYKKQAEVPKNMASNKRDEELRQKQKEIKIKNLTLQELDEELVRVKSLEIPESDISSKVTTTNDNMKKVRFPNISKTYNEKVMIRDTANILNSLADKDIPVYIRDVKVEDSSDLLWYKDTYKVSLEDANRVRHTLVFDLPKFIDNEKMYLNGNFKSIVSQQFPLPIIKIRPDEVHCTSNYNKVIVSRYGVKVSSELEKFRKALSLDITGINVKTGNYFIANKQFITTIEYDFISKFYQKIKIGKNIFMFDCTELTNKIEKEFTQKMTDVMLPFGYNVDNKSIYYIDKNTQKVCEFTKSNALINTDMSTINFICSLNSKLQEEMGNQSSGKKFMYTRAKIMNKQVPLVLLISYFEGISGMLKRAEIKHRFSDTRPKNLGTEEGVIQFSDGYLIYDKYPFENSLLMNAFADLPTKTFTYDDFDTKEVYMSIFEMLYRRNIALAFDNFKDSFVDPVTLEVLRDFDLPEDFSGILIYANKLLSDNHFTKENEGTYRIRKNEVVNAFLYKSISKAYEKYKATSMNNNPVKISIPQDKILKDIMTCQIVEDCSELNPIVDLEKARACTPKGPDGCNVSQAYNLEKRSYDKSMLGIFAMSTSPDANCGVVRQLAMEPNITSARGYIKRCTKDTVNKLKDVNIFSPAELLTPMGASCDDSIRTAMATKQSKHIIPVRKSSPVLISNGAERTIQHHLGKNFVFVAEESGVVNKVDLANNLILITYDSGKKAAIDIAPRIVKNGAGGFYLTNRLNGHVKEGQKFDASDILASDDKFFSESKTYGNRMNIGSFQKVAIYSSYTTYEDASEITDAASKDMGTEMSMCDVVSIGKNANVDFMVKQGQEIKVGDELIRYDSSNEDDSINAFLATIGDELGEEIKSLSKNKVTSHYSGYIEGIKILCTCDLEELSPSLRKIVSDYYAKINKRKKILESHDKANDNPLVKCGIIFNEPTDKVETKNGKIEGQHVDGVLIKFYIRYIDEVKRGDKITMFTANKTIVSNRIPKGLEPFSLHRPEEKIAVPIAPSAILQRGTPSIVPTVYGNKCLVELKYQLRDLLVIE